MSNLLEEYNIKDLRIVMINKDYALNHKNDYIEYFNENIKFIVEKNILEATDKYGLPYYAEYYTECITEEDLSVRTNSKPFTDTPEMFSIVSRIPNKYFTKEELESGKIKVIRIFKILQDINVQKEDINEKGKIKRLKK